MIVATASVLWLSYPPLLAFVAALCFFLLVAQARGVWTPAGIFGLPNLVTTLRLVVTMGMLVGFAHEPAWVLAIAALVNLLLDILDGWLARRSGISCEPPTKRESCAPSGVLEDRSNVPGLDSLPDAAM